MQILAVFLSCLSCVSQVFSRWQQTLAAFLFDLRSVSSMSVDHALLSILDLSGVCVWVRSLLFLILLLCLSQFLFETMHPCGFLLAMDVCLCVFGVYEMHVLLLVWKLGGVLFKNCILFDVRWFGGDYLFALHILIK